MSAPAPVTRAPNPWWVALVCGLASFIDAAAIVSNGIALTIYQHAIGISDLELGVLSAALTYCIAIGAVVGGWLGDRVGRRRVFLVTMAMIIVGIGLLVASTTFWLLLVGEILIGLGTGADLPVSLASIAEAADDHNRGKLIGFSGILWLVGILAVVVTSIFVGDLGHVGGQLLYGMVGVVAIVTLALRWSIPESQSWLAARRERSAGVKTVRADRARLGLLLRAPYAKPFLALILFYALTNLGANTGGQFTTFLWVNVIGTSVSFSSTINLVMFPIGLVCGFWFMRIADTPARWTYFLVGAGCMVVQYLLPAVLGFSMWTMLASMALSGLGSAFAFEGIMKVWTQESFPVLLRTTAQGAVLAVARFAAGTLAIVTPMAMNAGPRVLYAGLALVCAIGLGFAAWGFKGKQGTEFDIEDEVPDPLPA